MSRQANSEDNFTIRELKKMASEAGVKNYGYMRKAELADSLGLNPASENFFCYALKGMLRGLFFAILSTIVGMASILFISLLAISLDWEGIGDPAWFEDDKFVAMSLFGIFLVLTATTFLGLSLSAFFRKLIYLIVVSIFSVLVLGFLGVSVTNFVVNIRANL